MLEVGGTHVTAARVHRASAAAWHVEDLVRRPLDAQRTATELLDDLASAAAEVRATDVVGVALPGPFDVETGIAGYADDKLTSLHGVDVGAGLRGRLAVDVVFVNDADAFALGAWALGSSPDRLIGLTLGTGVGSGFVAGGHLVHEGPGLPPGGEVHLLLLDGRPLEETFSRRALLASCRPGSDVRDLCALARAGDVEAVDVLRASTHGLGRCLAPVISAFGADVVVGGSIARSWDLLGPWFTETAGVRAVPVEDPERAALVGAALVARSEED